MSLIRRVIIESDTFRVSLPGKNAAQARMDESAFDAEFPMVGTAFKGQVALRSKKVVRPFPAGVSFDVAPILLWGWYWNRTPSILYAPTVRRIPSQTNPEPYAHVTRTSVEFVNDDPVGGVYAKTAKWKVLI